MNVETLDEFLYVQENQVIVLGKIIEMLRATGEWKRRGYLTKIGQQTGFSPAYVGQVLNEAKPIRANFTEKMAGYLGVSVSWLRGEDERTCSNLGDRKPPGLDREGISMLHGAEIERKLTEEEMTNFQSLKTAYLGIPASQRDRALLILTIFAGTRLPEL